jgi:hypothetical protein
VIANVIHDSRREDRWNMLMEQADTNGFRFRLWPAQFFNEPKVQVLGPWAAHKQIIRWAKEEKMPYVWICEDDVQFTHPKAIDYFLSQIPQDGETNLFLGGVWSSRWIGGELRSWSGIHCYVVFSRFYDRYLAAPEVKPVDIWLAEWHATYGGNRIKVCRPLVAKCYDGLSGTTGKHLVHANIIGEDNTFYNG